MAKARLPRINIRHDEVEQASDDVQTYSDIIEAVVEEIVTAETKELDDVIHEIKDLLSNRQDIEVADLNHYIAALPTLMYFVGDRMESVGIKSDSSAAIRRERYDNFYVLARGKTINDKQSETNKLVMNESIIEAAYKRSYKKIQIRIELADSLLTSLKKVLQWRISELEVTGYKIPINGSSRK